MRRLLPFSPGIFVEYESGLSKLELLLFPTFDEVNTGGDGFLAFLILLSSTSSSSIISAAYAELDVVG